MNISERIEFDSPPDHVRRAIIHYVDRRVPRASEFIRWDKAGRNATASKMGASGSIRLSGDGPTVVEIEGKVGLPASLLVTEDRVRAYLREAIRDLKQQTP